MTELDDALRRDLAALRRRDGPPPGVEDRVLAALDGVPLVPSPELGAATGGSAGVKLVFAAKVTAAVSTLTVAGLLALRGAVLAVRALAPVESPPEAVESVHEDPPNSPRSSAERAGSAPEQDAAAATSPVPAEVAEVAEVAAAPEARGRPREASSRQSSEPSSVEPSPAGVEPQPEALARELALIQGARRAHAAGDSEAALAALGRHEREFEAGALATERSLLELEILCALGRDELAATKARALIARVGPSPERAKVHSACPQLEL